MLSPRYRDILCQTALGALSLANCQILVNSVRPGSWNAIVPIHGVSYAAAMALIIDAADGQGWLRDLVQRLVDDYPTRPEFAAVLVEIDRGRTDVAQIFAGPRRPDRRALWRLAITGGLLAIVLIVVAITYVRKNQRVEPSSPGPMLVARKARRSIAVIGFRNQAGKQDAAWLSSTLAELYNSELLIAQTLRVIPGENVARMKVELHLAETDSLAPDSLQKIRKSVGADLVLVGTYLTGMGKIRISVQLQDTVAGETLLSVIGDGSEDNLADLISRTGAELRAKIGAGRTAVPPSMISATLPANVDAVRLYAAALERLRAFDALRARDLLEQVVALDPNHALAHSALASAWASLGYDSKARDEAKKAYDLSKSLPWEQQRLVEARYREAAREWDKAITVYRTLWNLTSDNVEYGLALARVSVAGGLAADAAGIVENLRKLPLPARDDPRIDLAESSAAFSLGELKRARNAATQAAAKASQAGARLLLARARLQESQASLELSELQKATDAANEAREIYDAMNNRGGRSDALLNLAVSLHYQGDLNGARDLYEESRAIKRQIGDKRGVAKVLNNIAAVELEQGNPNQAKLLFEESLALHKEIDDQSGVGSVLNNIAAIVLAQGDLKGAKEKYQQLLEIAYRTDDDNATALAQYNIALLMAEEGNLAAALQNLEKALATQRSSEEKGAMADSLVSMAGIFKKQGDLDKARSKLSEALEVYTNAKATDRIFQVQLALADLAREDRRGAGSEELARACSDHFRQAQSPNDEAEARAVLAGALLDQRKLAEATREIELAQRVAARSQHVYVRLSVDLMAARIRAASGRMADMTNARQSLQAGLDMATKNGWIARQLEIQMVLSEVELKMDSAAGRARLEQLERDATAYGFLLIARRASAMRRAAA
jgi:tetratricopeptide (TPR) repeat protein